MIYEHYCPNCKRRELMKVIRISRRRGLKLECLKCGRPLLRYIKGLNLIESKGGDFKK